MAEDERLVGLILAALRQAELTQQAAAEKIGMSQYTFIRRMKEPSTWTIGELRSLAVACSKDKEYFFYTR